MSLHYWSVLIRTSIFITVVIIKMQVWSVLVNIPLKCTQDFILSVLYRSNRIWLRLVIVPYSYSENGCNDKTNTIHIQWNLSITDKLVHGSLSTIQRLSCQQVLQVILTPFLHIECIHLGTTRDNYYNISGITNSLHAFK